jgi:predicted DNA-binding transcriptional regulator AlpA
MATLQTRQVAPSRHHIDKRANELIQAHSRDGADDLLNTKQVAGILGLSTQWLEIGRCRGFGPPFVRLSPRRIRYRREALITWLRQREHNSTIEYARSSACRQHVRPSKRAMVI